MTARRLLTPAAAAMYVGAVLGPGVLLTPALVTRLAGPASIVAWALLLALSVPLVVTFAALGARLPEAGGTAAYARAAFGAAAGRATGWLFLAGVLLGAPVVAFAGGRYVAAATTHTTLVAVAVAAGVVAVVVAIVAVGVTATARLQLALAAVLAALLALAVATALPSARAANWTPFAPRGTLAVGSAASVLMFSFIGWEAVSHLVGELRDPRRQLPRAIAGAFAVIALLYAGLAVATVGVLGPRPSAVPIADLMAAGLGEGGRRATVGVAVLLTVGTMTTYVAGAVKLTGALLPPVRPRHALAAFVVTTAASLGAVALGALGADALTRASSACFVAVYVLATAAGVRLLRGAPRAAAGVSLAVTLVLLAFSGVALLVPATVVALAAGAGQVLGPHQRARHLGRPSAQLVAERGAARLVEEELDRG